MYNKNLVFTASCLGMLIFGVVLTTLGVILPSLIVKFNIDKIHAGTLMSLMSIGILTGSLTFGPIADRYGYKGLLSISALLVLIGMEGIAVTTEFFILRIAVFLIGFGGGIINGGTNALVADISEGGRSANLSLLGMFFGLGAIGMPLLLGFLMNRISYESFLGAVGIFVLLPTIFFLSIRFPLPKQPDKIPLRQGFSLLKKSTLLILSLILFFESGIEITIASWTTLFLNEELAVQPDQAVFYLSFFWLGMVLARFVLGYILKSVAPDSVLLTCLAIAFFGTLLMFFSHDVIVTVFALSLIGIGFAAGFPVILGYIGDLFPQLSGTAFSIAFVIALIGGTILPFVTGVSADSFGLRYSILLVPVCLAGMVILFLIIRNRIHRDISTNKI